MKQVLRAVYTRELIAATHLAAAGDWLAARWGRLCGWWAVSAARRLGKLSGKHTENTGA